MQRKLFLASPLGIPREIIKKWLAADWTIKK
jgi:hypothetical protein